MKVVLFCGGLGTRLRDYSDTLPKPLVPIGDRPLLWHILQYYSHHGHREFILCLGHRGDAIKQYFRQTSPFQAETDDWRITFVDTGIASNIGQRLRAIEGHLGDDDVFLANYTDVLSDLPLDEHVEHALARRRVATFLAVRPSQTFHVVEVGEDSRVQDFRRVSDAGLWINGGFFVFRRQIFDYLGPGEELVEAPFLRLVAEKQLVARCYGGFWACVDTFQDKQALDNLVGRGETPWQVWTRSNHTRLARRAG